jgi:hypothetical protein
MIFIVSHVLKMEDKIKYIHTYIQEFQCYITILLGVVLVRSAPTTFHIVDVDDFTSIDYSA